MVGISFDLRRASHVALDEHAMRVAADWHRGGEENRLARDQILRLPNVRDDLLRGTIASRQTAERHRGAHELHEIAPVDATLQRQRAGGELRLHDLLEILARQLLEAPPVLGAEPFFEACEVELFVVDHQSSSNGTSSTPSTSECCTPAPAAGRCSPGPW